AAALEAATAKGDAKVADAARDGLSKVRVRLGQEPAPAEDEWPEALVETVVEAMGNANFPERIDALVDDMELYGDRVVPLFVDWLAKPKGTRTDIGGFVVASDPQLAARALGRF